MKHYVTNGLNFRTKESETNKKTQNSGVSVVIEGGVTYYSILIDIIDYLDKERHVLFKCKWVDVQSRKRYKTDELGFPLVNFTHLIHVRDELMDEPYVLAFEASQVFYVEDKRENDWYKVVKTKVRDVFDVGSGHLCGKDDMDTYCENVSYNINADNVVFDNIGLTWVDVEGTTLNASIIDEKDLQEGDFVDDNDFIDDEFSNE